MVYSLNAIICVDFALAHKSMIFAMSLIICLSPIVLMKVVLRNNTWEQQALSYASSCLLSVFQAKSPIFASSQHFQEFILNFTMVLTFLLLRCKSSLTARTLSGVLASFVLRAEYSKMTFLSFLILLLVERDDVVILILSASLWIFHPAICICLIFLWILLPFTLQGKEKRVVLFTTFLCLTSTILPSSFLHAPSSIRMEMTTTAATAATATIITPNREMQYPAITTTPSSSPLFTSSSSGLLQVVHWVVWVISFLLASQVNYPSSLLLVLFISRFSQTGTYLHDMNVVLSHILAISSSLHFPTLFKWSKEKDLQEEEQDGDKQFRLSSNRQTIAGNILVCSVVILIVTSLGMTVYSYSQPPITQCTASFNTTIDKTMMMEEADEMVEYLKEHSITPDAILRAVKESDIAMSEWNAIVGKNEEEAYHVFSVSSFKYILFTPWDPLPYRNEECSVFSIAHGKCSERLYSLNKLFITRSSLFSLYQFTP